MLVTRKSKLTKPVRKPKATRVDPKLIDDVEYRDITSDVSPRHSSFKGLSKDRS
jgi:bifunctional non-homologous end joining protein LigD